MGQELIDAIDNVIRFMEAHHVSGWPEQLKWLREDVSRLKPDDTVGWRNLFRRVRLFGGMGALDDVVICRENGHEVADEAEANIQHAALVGHLARVWDGYRRRYGT